MRDGKGSKDRVTVLPEGLMAPLREHLARVEQRHRVAVQNGHGGVELPSAIERKYPNAYLAWGWQYVFPARSPSRDPRTGSWRRHYILESTVQRQIAAVRTAGIAIYTHVMRKGAGAVRSPLD